MLFTGRAVGATVGALIIMTGLVGPSAAQTPTVRVGGTGNYGPVLPIIAGQKLGLFEKAGVKVEFTNFSGGSASMEGLAAGEVDLINFFPPGLALARSRGVKATIVSAGTITPRGWQIMVKKDSPITDPKQLVGKKIGISANGSTTDFFALWVANRAGGSVTRVPVGGGGLIPNLISGNVDAIVAYPPLSYRVGLSGDGRMLVDLGKDMKPNLPDVWIASDKALKDNPDGIKRALVGLFSAVKYMKANPEWSIKFIQEQTKFDAEVAKAEFENTIMGLSDNGELKEEWVAESLELGKLAGLANLPAPKDLFNAQFVPVQTITP